MSVYIRNALPELLAGESGQCDPRGPIPYSRRFAVETRVDIGCYGGGIVADTGIGILFGHRSADQFGQAVHTQVAHQSAVVVLFRTLS